MAGISEYKPEICAMLVAKMGQGLTFNAACADLGIGPRPASDWQKIHPEFLEARNLGMWKHQLFYERLLQHSAIGITPDDVVVNRNGREITKKSKGVNTISVQFALSRVHPDQYGAEKEKTKPLDLENELHEIEKLEEDIRNELARHGLVSASSGKTARDNGKAKAPSKAKGKKKPS